MVSKITYVLHLTILSFFVCGLLGCANLIPNRDRRYYSGPLLSSNEVALVYAPYSCQIVRIRGEHEKMDKMIISLTGPRLSEFPPGKYIASFWYYDGFVSGDNASINLNLSAGNIYIVYPHFSGKALPGYLILHGGATGEAWQPIFMNIADYNEEKCIKEETSRSCPDKKTVIEWASKYFQGERRAVTLTKDENGYHFLE